MSLRIRIERKAIADFCRRWKITEFARWSLSDLMEMEEQLTELFERRVDLVEKEGLRNPFRRRSILSTREVIYAA